MNQLTSRILERLLMLTVVVAEWCRVHILVCCVLFVSHLLKKKTRVYTLHWHQCSHSISLCVSLFFDWRKENLQCGIGSQQPPPLYVGFLWSNLRSFVSWTVFFFIQTNSMGNWCEGWLWIRMKGIARERNQSKIKITEKHLTKRDINLQVNIGYGYSFLSG